MTHKRLEIRQEVVGRLINETLAEGNVFDTRLFSQDSFEVNSILVWIREETNEDVNHGEQLNRTGVVIVECRVLDSPQGGTLIDQITNEVEQRIFCGENPRTVDMTLGGLGRYALAGFNQY